MVGGMATISGGIMAVYIGLGADPVAILATSVMAAPCGLYLSKILYPETEEPATRGEVKVAVEQTARQRDRRGRGGRVRRDDAGHQRRRDADRVPRLHRAGRLRCSGCISPGLSLARIFAWVFAPVAVLMGSAAAGRARDRRSARHEARRQRVRGLRQVDDAVPHRADAAVVYAGDVRADRVSPTSRRSASSSAASAAWPRAAAAISRASARARCSPDSSPPSSTRRSRRRCCDGASRGCRQTGVEPHDVSRTGRGRGQRHQRARRAPRRRDRARVRPWRLRRPPAGRRCRFPTPSCRTGPRRPSSVTRGASCVGTMAGRRVAALSGRVALSTRGTTCGP